MQYNVLLSRQAEKQIKALPENIKIKVKDKLIGMQKNPLDGDVKKLKIHRHRYRLRIGDYRIIFDIDKKIVTVYVLTVKHRKRCINKDPKLNFNCAEWDFDGGDYDLISREFIPLSNKWRW